MQYIYVAKILCQASLPSFLTKSDNIFFRSLPNGNCLFSSASLPLVDNSLVHELRVMIAAVESYM